MPRSKSNDLLRSNGTIDSLRSSNRFSNFKALKQWGKHRLKFNKSNEARIDEVIECEMLHVNGNSNLNDNVKVTKPKSKSQAEKMLKQNPLYSLSEKLFTNLVEPEIKTCVTSTNPVKLRTSMTRRQRRNKQYRCEEPNSSSGNWSASSESGRTSASSEIAMQHKPSTSCTSLNHNNKPPLTICTQALTKRKINTSTSSSITSDDTLTHEIPSSGYVDYDDETSSMYSCDTEGYFTSFHVDSGLKTLKEEETVPAMISTSALINDSSISSSIGDSMSRTTISMDSDYELFGKGSTSTTASSAGTVCTALLGSLSNNSLVETPIAPERKSSLNSKLTNISNYAKPKSLMNKHEKMSTKSNNNDNETNRMARNTGALSSISNNLDLLNSNIVPLATISDVEISENSDFEGVEHVKRIQGKTKINSNRIPSICVITPLNSDDEDRVAAMESMLSSLNINQNDLLLGELNCEKTIAQVHTSDDSKQSKLDELLPLTQRICAEFPIEVNQADETDGEYVTITDVASYPNSYKLSDNVDNNLEKILSGNLNLKTEYVSLNELPCNTNYGENLIANGKNTKLIAGTNVKFNANGMFVYDSNTLRYKRSLCTTFKGIPSKENKLNNDEPSSQQQNVETHCDSKQQKIAIGEKGMSATSSPPFDKMASDSNSIGLDDVYVTLAVNKSVTLKNTEKPFTSVSDSGKI